MSADILTKSLPREKHFQCMTMLGMCLPPPPLKALFIFTSSTYSNLCGRPSYLDMSLSGRHHLSQEEHMSKTFQGTNKNKRSEKCHNQRHHQKIWKQCKSNNNHYKSQKLRNTKDKEGCSFFSHLEVDLGYDFKVATCHSCFAIQPTLLALQLRPLHHREL